MIIGRDKEFQVRIHRRVQSSPLRSLFSNLYSRWGFPFPSEQQHTSLDMKTQYGWSSSIISWQRTCPWCHLGLNNKKSDWCLVSPIFIV